MGRSERPEHTAPPDVYYNDEEAQKYTNNTRIINIQVRWSSLVDAAHTSSQQNKLTQRAMELLALPDDGTPRLLLDIGCGSGLSGEAITERGHQWVVRTTAQRLEHRITTTQGVDISKSMLDVALEREVEGDVCLADMGHGLPLRMGMFDGAISISAVQWLCNADSSSADPRKRMRRFFDTLYSSLTKGARAVLQVYPENAQQAELLTLSAMRAGFAGGLVVDYPNSTRAKKYFLVLMVGGSAVVPAAKGTGDAMETSDVEEEEEGRGAPQGVRVDGRKRHKGRHDGKGGQDGKGRGWILKKKQQMRGKGYTNIPADTKYTGRKRKAGF